jgi:phosphate:Na+ symporter
MSELVQHSSFASTMGGVAIFLLGLSMASENLQKIAANRIRQIVTTLAKNPVWGVGLGVMLTIVLQSSGAVTSMLVGLGSAGVITLSEVMSVILGTAIGATLTIQILSLDVARFGLPLFTMSFFVFWLSKRRVLKECAAAAMGFGLLFFGLQLIRLSTNDLKDVPQFMDLVHSLNENPLYALLVTAFLTAVVGSSAITISIGMTLTASGFMTLHDSMYWIFGANIGTTATALLAAAGGNYVGRQVAWAHTLYKLASVVIFLPVAGLMSQLVDTTHGARDVANLNTFFNCAAALVFFPFIRKGANLVEKLFPPTPAEMQFSVKYLKKKDWESPSVIVAHAEREVLRMADIVLSMIDESLNVFRCESSDLVESVRRRDDRVDLLARELNMYLAQQIDKAPEGLRQQMLKLMYFVTDLEATADVVDNQLLELAQKKHTLKVDFSEEGWQDLKELQAAVALIAQMSIACFQTQDKDLASKVVFHKRNVRRLEQKMRESHMSRLVKGTPESIVTSSIHLDVLGEYRRIVGLLSNHVYSLLKESDPYGLLPRRE